MDRQTLAAYDRGAAAFAKDWHEQPPPLDLHEIVKRFFIANGVTADIGCGSGREVGWLNANGFPAKGFDASDGLLAEARTRYPPFEFAHAELPHLSGIAAESFDNVLCETVIMHLDRAQIATSVRRMLEMVKPGGILYLSWRVTEGENQRDKHERLYAAFAPLLVRSELTGRRHCSTRSASARPQAKRSPASWCARRSEGLFKTEPRPGGGKTGRGTSVPVPTFVIVSLRGRLRMPEPKGHWQI